MTDNKNRAAELDLARTDAPKLNDFCSGCWTDDIRHHRGPGRYPMRVYISGPITGVPDYRENFAAAAAQIEALGHEVVNPAAEQDTAPPRTWQEWMRHGLVLMLGCGEVVAIAGFSASRGAQTEIQCARNIGMRVRPIGAFLLAHGKAGAR